MSKSNGTPAVGAGSWPFRRHEPADPMCHIGLARGRSAPPSNLLLPAAQPGLRAGGAALGSAPSTPARRYGATTRRFGPPSTRRRRVARRRQHERRATPAVNPLRGSSADATVLRMTAAAGRAGWRLRASQQAGPRSRRTRCAAPLSRRTGPATAPATSGPAPSKASRHQRTGHRAGRVASSQIGSPARRRCLDPGRPASRPSQAPSRHPARPLNRAAIRFSFRTPCS